MIKLFGSPDPQYASNLKIRVALIEAGADFELVPIDLSKGEHKTAEFLAINPHGKVPALVDGYNNLAETNAILWYIAETFPAAKLLPADPIRKAKVLQFLDMVGMHIYGPQYDYYLNTAGNAPEKRNVEVAEKAKTNMDRALAVLETALSGAHEFLVGADAIGYSIADISAAATLRGMKERLPAYATLAPHTEAWLDRILARPAWQKACAKP